MKSVTEERKGFKMDDENELFNKKSKEPFKIEFDDTEYSGIEENKASEDKKFRLDSDFLEGLSEYEEPKGDAETDAGAVVVPGGKRNLHIGFAVKIVAMMLIVIVSVWVAMTCFKAANDLLGMIPKNEIVVVNIPRDASVSEVSDILSENGVVEFGQLFKMYTRLKYDGIEFRTGQVAIDLSQSAGYDNIISAVRYSVNNDVVTVTIPEGFTIAQIAQRLEDNGVCSSSSFIAAAKRGNFDDYDFVRAIQDDTTKYLTLEGYIFPDTYEFYVNDDAVNVVRKFLDNFEAKFTDEMKARANNMGFTVDEVVTLASIVQSESGDKTQMPIIASIFINRLNDTSVSRGRLESDVTINYVEQYIGTRVSEEEFEEYSRNYNTYKCTGIPAGAVSNPGVDAINAVLYPEETPYFFFVNDVLGNYYYAETLEEHNANVRIAFSVGEEE